MAYREGLQSGIRKQLGFAFKDISEHPSVLLAFYDSSVIEDRKIGAVSFSEVKVNIVI